MHDCHWLAEVTSSARWVMAPVAAVVLDSGGVLDSGVGTARSKAQTDAPACAKATAIAWPIPPAAPVMQIVFPAKGVGELGGRFVVLGVVM